MNFGKNILTHGSMITSPELKPSVILISASIVLAMHRDLAPLGMASVSVLPGFPLDAVQVMFVTAFLLMGVLPVILTRSVFHDRLTDYGVRLGDWKTGLLSIAVLYPLIAALLLYPASQTADMRAFYPLDKSATTLSSLLSFELLRIIFFYTAWEFFFRGFMLFGLRERFGDWTAICIQTIPSCLWHIGYPSGELFSSIAGGLLFGILAIRTRSIVWAWILHVLIGVTLDVCIIITN